MKLRCEVLDYVVTRSLVGISREKVLKINRKLFVKVVPMIFEKEKIRNN